MFNKRALEHTMLDASCTNKELAKACGISPSALYRRLSGSVPFNVGEIDRCSEFLRLTPDKRNEIFFAEKVS